MSKPEPITAATQELITLLRRWPRQQLASVLLNDEEPRKALLNGRLREHLGVSRKRHISPPAKEGAALGLFDKHFPELLRAIPDPPLVLYYHGDLALLDGPAIAIVGARKCTSQGKRNAQTLARDIAGFGVHVVSGLALGIDGAAHIGALEARGSGRTIAVLGAGLAQIYPHRHDRLARDIIDAGGLLLTEYPPLQTPRPHQFPERNRLISGLSLATVVVEAGDRSAERMVQGGRFPQRAGVHITWAGLLPAQEL